MTVPQAIYTIEAGDLRGGQMLREKANFLISNGYRMQTDTI